MRLLAPDIPPHVADVIRRLPPDVKHSIKQAIRALAQNPQIGRGSRVGPPQAPGIASVYSKTEAFFAPKAPFSAPNMDP